MKISKDLCENFILKFKDYMISNSFMPDCDSGLKLSKFD